MIFGLAAEQLVASRLILPADVELVVVVAVDERSRSDSELA
jgi:hypothetical protein